MQALFCDILVISTTKMSQVEPKRWTNVSPWAPPRNMTPPFPVRYISAKPSFDGTMIPPVGKSGPGMTSSRFSSVHFSGLAAYTHSASATSPIRRVVENKHSNRHRTCPHDMPASL